MAEVNLIIAGRSYKVACREGEEPSLLAAARLVDEKSRDVIAGLGSLSESRQLLFASLLLADQLATGARVQARAPSAPPPSAPEAVAVAAEPLPAQIDEALLSRAETLADLLEALAEGLEASHPAP